MIQKKIIKILQLIVGVAKYCRVSMRCTKFRFPIGVIVFDELELISFVSQGLTLSTASLVFCYFDMKNEKGAEMFCVNLSDARGKWIVNTKHIASLPRLTADHLPFATHCQVTFYVCRVRRAKNRQIGTFQ